MCLCHEFDIDPLINCTRIYATSIFLIICAYAFTFLILEIFNTTINHMKHTHTQGTHKHFIELCAQTAVHIHMRAHVYVNNHTISIIISSGLCYFLTFKNFESTFQIFFFIICPTLCIFCCTICSKESKLICGIKALMSLQITVPLISSHMCVAVYMTLQVLWVW